MESINPGRADFETPSCVAASNLRERVLKPAARAAGVPWAGWHTLRHTCGSMLFRSGANAKQVQHWLGHHSPAFTLAVYIHLLPEDAADPRFLDDVTRPSPDEVRPPIPCAAKSANA
jgi:integrase